MYPDIQISMYPDIHVSRYPTIQISHLYLQNVWKRRSLITSSTTPAPILFESRSSHFRFRSIRSSTPWLKLVTVSSFAHILFIFKIVVTGSTPTMLTRWWTVGKENNSQVLLVCHKNKWRELWRKLVTFFCDNYVPQWWVELDDELFTNRLSVTG